MKTASLFFATVLCFYITACAPSVNTIENQDKQAQPTAISDSRFVTDSFLSNRLVLTGVRTGTTVNGLLTVEITAFSDRTSVGSKIWAWITNTDPYPVDYKFTWQDQNGMTVDTPLSIWQTRQIIPGETVSFRSTAPSTSCKDFVLNLKESKHKIK